MGKKGRLVGRYIDVPIEDYVYRKTAQGYKVRNNPGKVEALMMVVGIAIWLMSLYIFYDIELVEEYGNVVGGTYAIFKSALYSIPVLIAVYVALVVIERLTGNSLDEKIKKELNNESKITGYKLKILEEFDYSLYTKVDKWYHEGREMDSGTLNSLNKYFGEFLWYLNREVQLDTGYITRRYEVITLKNEKFVYSTDCKELRYRLTGETSIKPLNQESAVEWYRNLVELSNSLYELKYLAEVQETLRLNEVNRLNEIQKIRDSSKKEEGLLNLSTTNDDLRGESLSQLGKTELVKGLEFEIGKVNKDSEQVYKEGMELVEKGIKELK